MFDAAPVDLSSKIAAIGQSIAECSLPCRWIERDQNDGILPRGLYLEERAPEGKPVAIVGINPGRMDAQEQAKYRSFRVSYEAVREWYASHIETHAYYAPLRELADKLGFHGHILWTELVKCQSTRDAKWLHEQTLRACIYHHLKRELDCVPDWPLIAAGFEPYRALVFLYPERGLFGVPHPNARGQLQALLKRDDLSFPAHNVARWYSTKEEEP